ncbi:Adenine-specific methyltransferase EcoRI [Treponema berlinense]|uniref:Adenine-specific methyltransferase EcoRI n=1 Tax=Treponema berlinense TaxID=225004 RepID=A0A1T4P4N1_9SPIR|nr:adenine-specific methyltransferase EcoRI family protein [Treponema berlinense]SJZ86409.1 Adenine-specific methyltransferase EcoRI [Treponema berlinense]
MAGNSNLHASRADKADEFYTQLSLVENELKHYRKHFEGKTVLCNCDDPYESNFFKFFAMNFNALKLRKLISTCYATSPIAQRELSLFPDLEEPQEERASDKRKPYKVQITEVADYNNDGAVDLSDVEWLLKNKNNTRELLKGDGDFRSAECIELLKEADIVVTNPPFSLFREYVAQLVEFKKDFIILGNQNAITYREILPLIRDNKIWLGYNSGHFWFKVPDSYEEKATDFKIDENGQKWRRMGNICFFTNLDIEKRHEDMVLFRNYTPEAYPKYDNYDAIEVSKTVDIPCDYFGVMGVPITFMDKFNPSQFEILGDSRYHDGQDFSDDINVINGKTLYRRILIRRINKGE